MIKINVTSYDPKRLDTAARQVFQREAKGFMDRSSGVLLSETQGFLRRTPPPSAPGSPPALRTGDLLRSFTKLRTRVNLSSVTGGIRSSDPGAGRVEYGATDVRGIRTYPHPYMDPAKKVSEPQIDRMANQMLTRLP